MEKFSTKYQILIFEVKIRKILSILFAEMGQRVGKVNKKRMMNSVNLIQKICHSGAWILWLLKTIFQKSFYLIINSFMIFFFFFFSYQEITGLFSVYL